MLRDLSLFPLSKPGKRLGFQGQRAAGACFWHPRVGGNMRPNQHSKEGFILFFIFWLCQAACGILVPTMKRANIIPIPFPRRDETPFQAPSLQLTVGTVPCVTPCLLSNEGSCYFCANSYPLVPPKLKPMRPGSLR